VTATGNRLNRALWIVAGLLAAELLFSSAKAVVPKVFVGAVIMRLCGGERATILIDLTNLAMAAFVAWGRFGPRSFGARRASARPHA
jgi:hypothetical protein